MSEQLENIQIEVLQENARLFKLSHLIRMRHYLYLKLSKILRRMQKPSVKCHLSQKLGRSIYSKQSLKKR